MNLDDGDETQQQPKDLTVHTGRAINPGESEDYIVTRAGNPRDVILLDSQHRESISNRRISFLIRKHGRTKDFSSLYLPEEDFRKFLDHNGVPQLTLIEAAMVKAKVKEQTHFSGNPDGLFFYDSSTKLQGSFPFALVARGEIRDLTGRVNQLFNRGVGIKPEFDYIYHSDDNCSGISGISKRDFRTAASWLFRDLNIKSQPIKGLALGPYEQGRYISCLTLRDCVQEFAKTKRR